MKETLKVYASVFQSRSKLTNLSCVDIMDYKIIRPTVGWTRGSPKKEKCI